MPPHQQRRTRGRRCRCPTTHTVGGCLHPYPCPCPCKDEGGGLGVKGDEEFGVPHAFAGEEPPVGVIFFGGGCVGGEMDGGMYVCTFSA